MTQKITKSEQSRINGAKSKGPTSIDGKARSSQNAIKHGFASVINVVLRIEDKQEFELHVQGLRSAFKPVDYAEQLFVDQLAAINWRQSRLIGLETALIDAQIDLQQDHVRAINPEAADEPYFHLVKAWQALARQPQPLTSDEQKDPSLPPDGYDINSLELVRRYQVSLDRQFRNVLLNLRQYRKDFAPPPPPNVEEPVERPVEEPKEPTRRVSEPSKLLENEFTPRPIHTLTIVKPAAPSTEPTPPKKNSQ